jgi:hypothetical protein
MGAFPDRFETVVTPNDFDFLATPKDGPKRASAFICIERLELEGVAQRARREMKTPADGAQRHPPLSC